MHTHRMKWNELTQARQALGLDRSDLAGLLQISPAWLFIWESGLLPVPSQIAQLVEAFAQGYRPDNWPVGVGYKPTSGNRTVGASVVTDDADPEEAAQEAHKSVYRADDWQSVSPCSQDSRAVAN